MEKEQSFQQDQESEKRTNVDSQIILENKSKKMANKIYSHSTLEQDQTATNDLPEQQSIPNTTMTSEIAYGATPTVG